MEKPDQKQLPIQQQQQQEEVSDGTFFCERCFNKFSFKCVFILLLTFALFFSTLFMILPRHHYQLSSFDANSWIKKTVIVQAYFRLEKPVSELIPEIARLEYDINGEIGVHHTKVVVLSMHQSDASNWTDVVFGYLPDPVNAPADPVSLAVLKPALIDLFLQQLNLTLTNSSFGQTSSFEILEFPGGVSVIPKQFPFWPNGQILFNFALNNSMSEVNENIVQLREQLKLGLHLMPDENVYVKLTNKNGSTRDPPITVEASITSVFGSLSPKRLKQLAQNITRSPGKNLGLNNTVFGKVKEVSLSSYLNHTIDISAPSPSPAPSPMQNDYPGPSPTPYASLSPSYSPSPSTSFPYPPDGRFPRSPQSEPPFVGSPAPMAGHCGNQLPPSLSPAPRAPDLPPPASSPPPTNDPTSHISPSPLPSLSYGSNRRRHESSEALPFTSMAPSQLFFHKKSWWFCFIGVLASHLAWLDLLI